MKEKPAMKPTVSIPTELLHALVARHMSGTELQLVLVLAELTIGRGEWTVQVTLTELARRLRSSPTVVGRVAKDLEEARLIERSGRVGDVRGRVYRLRTDPELWARSAKVPGARIEVMERDKETCRYCGESRPGRMTIDHVIPRTLGGSEGLENMVVACEACNHKKSGMGFEEFLNSRPDLRLKFLPLIIWYEARRAPPVEESWLEPAPPAKEPRRRPYCPVLKCDCPVRGRLPSLARPEEIALPLPWTEPNVTDVKERANESASGGSNERLNGQ